MSTNSAFYAIKIRGLSIQIVSIDWPNFDFYGFKIRDEMADGLTKIANLLATVIHETDLLVKVQIETGLKLFS